ncbi:hypothetical protein KKC32_03140 [Patescibacteria group bacterium]|nr:hypothetical protein [Patescibacteria group bacterium]
METRYTKEAVLIYLENMYKKTNYDKLASPRVRMDIIKLIETGCEITNLSEADLLAGLDFKPNDLKIESLEAFLAELRSIFWLRHFGFTDIQPIKAARKSKMPDFIAKYKENICAIEVFCLTSAHEQQRDSVLCVYKNFDPQFNGSKFGRDFMSTAPNKLPQLDSINAEIKILLCVINSRPIIFLNSVEEIHNHAKSLYEKLNLGNDYYLGILAGESYAIYPKLT